MKNLSKLLTGLLLICLSACTKQDSETLFEEQMFVMGTVVNVTIYGETEARSKKVFHDLLKDFKYMNAAWGAWNEGSLRRINSLIQYNEAFSIGPALIDMIQLSTELSRKSDYLFNPAIGKLVQLWGFHQAEAIHGPPPGAEEIKKILDQRPLMEDLTIEGLTLRSKNPSLLIDFGGFAKGYAIDKAIDYLKSIGIENAIINAGGDLRALGGKNKKPWVIGIRHPRQQGVLASLEIAGDESVFTSGDYERFYDYEGVRYHHILDPRTGYPTQGTQSVTVIHRSGAIADAAATALMVAGVPDWEKIARQLNLDQVMLIDSKGEIYLTSKMKERLTFIPDVSPTLHVSTSI